MSFNIIIPIGRKIKQALIQERRREAQKAKCHAVSRKGDSLSTGHICVVQLQLDTPGQGTCFANSILVARVSDPTVSHPNPPLPPCVPM